MSHFKAKDAPNLISAGALLQRSPDLLAGLKGRLLLRERKGRKTKRREGKRGKEKGKKKGGEGGERKKREWTPQDFSEMTPLLARC